MKKLLMKIKPLFFGFFILFSCTGDDEMFTPKKYGHLRIDLTEENKNYTQIEKTCFMLLEIPDYAKIIKKNAPDEHTCFMDVTIPKHKATINITHKSIPSGDSMQLTAYLEHAHVFVHKHLIKADDYIDTLIFYPDKKVFAHVFNLTGDVASPMQFVATDSVNHFVRGSLDFFVKPNYDSILPVLNYIREDVYHMIKTIEWQN